MANRPTTDRYDFGPFRLDCGTRELRRGDEVVALTAKAFDLLLVLLTARDRIVEKTELLKLVWPDTFVGEDSLTQNIATLRKALGDAPGRSQYIVTVPRHGYRFVAPVRVEVAAPIRPEDPGVASATSSEGAALAVSDEPRAALHTAPLADRRPAIPWAGGPIALLVMTIFIVTALAIRLLPHTYAITPELTRFIVAAPEGTTFSPSASFLAVSPNGRLLAFLVARPGDETRLWVRSLDSLNARELTGTDGGLSPFWSPDSQSLGFFAHGQLKTVGLLGEPPRILCEVQPATPSATWSQEGVILFSHGDALFRISATGGSPRRVTSVDSTRGETAHVLPQFLPDGRRFIYVAVGRIGGARDSWIVSGSIDGSEHRQVMRATSQTLYAEPGYLLSLAEGALLAQPFDATHVRLLGRPLAVADADHVGFNAATPRGMFSVSSSGTLAYRPSTVRELGWFDRTGKPLTWIGAAGRDSDPALSPDGQRLAVSRYDPTTVTRNIWILGLGPNGIASPLTSHFSWATCPLWSPDGARIVFTSGGVENGQLYEKSVDGTTEARTLPESPIGCPLDWSPDRHVLYAKGRFVDPSEPDLWIASEVDKAVPTPLAGPRLRYSQGSSLFAGSKPWTRISPNGHWMAFVSDISGRNEIYVRSFPMGELGRWQISERGGIEPEWRRDGRELFFIGADKHLMAVPVATEGAFRAGTPSALFPTDLDSNGLGISGRNQYVVTAGGDRFLLDQPRPGAVSPPVTVLLNWTAALRK